MSDPTFTIKDAPTQNLIIQGEDQKPLVTISLTDGTVEFGEGYDPETSARTFWDAIGSYVQNAATQHGELVDQLKRCQEALEAEWHRNHGETCTNMDNCETFGGTMRCAWPRPAALSQPKPNTSPPEMT